MLAEPPGAAHQGSGGAGPDEQDVQFRELPVDRRRGLAVVRLPVVLVLVLVEPHVAGVGGTPSPHVVHPRTEEAAGRVGHLGDHVHLGAERLHQQPGLQVAAGVGHAQEPVALARRDHAQRDTEVARRGLDDDRPRPQPALAFGGRHHPARGLELDRPGEVEPFDLEEQRVPDDRPEVDEQVVLVELVGQGDDGHDEALISSARDCGVPRGLWGCDNSSVWRVRCGAAGYDRIGPRSGPACPRSGVGSSPPRADSPDLAVTPRTRPGQRGAARPHW